MEKLHLSVIAVVLYLNVPGSVGTKPQRILLATHHPSACRWDGEFFVNCSFTRASAVPEDVPQTATTADFSYNNITTFMCTGGRHEEWMLKHLNLSNNLISELSLTTFRNLPVLETLNLNDNAIHTLTVDIPTPPRGFRKYGKGFSLLPALKVLSVERNDLNAVPRGLCLLQSLQTVRLSSNSVREIDLEDFQTCSQLRDIDLQNNQITKIHPDAFRDLNKLQVVDLRENALTTPLPQILITLNFFQLEVDLSNNAWIANCRLNTFKHLFHFIFDSMRKKLSISYSKSANNSQKPLLHLSSFHLNCSDSVLLKRAVIPAGETLVLNCDLGNTRGNGVSWWTPKGRISEDNNFPHMTLDKMNHLVIRNAEETAEGLYLCLLNATKKKYLIYDTQVKERVSTLLVRKARDTLFRQGRTERDFTVAVCLSVLITFVCAFCLGAFARPHLVSLWALVRTKKNSASQQTYSNQGFSDGTCPASKPTNRQCNLFICDENSSGILPTETSAFYENVTDSSGRARNMEEEYQKQSNNEIKVKKKPVFSDIKTTISNDENINVYDEPLSIFITDKNRNQVTPRTLIRNDISLWEDSKYVNNTDSEKSRSPPTPRTLNADSYSKYTDPSDVHLPFTGETGFPSSVTQTHTDAQDSRNSKVSNNSGLLQSEITKATLGSPKIKGTISHNEPMSTTKFIPGRHNSDEQLGPNGNIDITNNAGDFILPSSCKRDTNTENSGVYQRIDNPPLRDYDYKTEHTNEKYASADRFGDSSSDEGMPFTLSDCSSLADFELEQPGVSNNLPVCQWSLEEADKNKGTGKFSTLSESPNNNAEFQRVGKDEDKNVYFESTINYGSDTITPETTSPYTEKCSNHASMKDLDTISSSSQEVPGTFDYFTNEETTVQNSISDSLQNQNTAFGNTSLSLKHSPTDDTDAEDTPEEAELKLDQFPTEPQRSFGFSPMEQKENVPEGSTDEHKDRNSSGKNDGEGNITLRRNISTSKNNDFIFTPVDTGLNGIVKNPPLLHSSNESPLQSLPEQTIANHFMVMTENKDLMPQGKLVNTTKARADKMQKGFNEEESDGCTELEESSNCSLPEETQSGNATADLLHLHPSGKIQSVFNTENRVQLDWSDEDAYSFSVPQGSFNDSTRYSSCSILQEATGNINSRSTDSSEAEDDTTLTGLKNKSTTVLNLQNSSEKISQKSPTNLGHASFFVKKRRAFDGFADVLQSRRINFDS